jgi:hypothetical protein
LKIKSRRIDLEMGKSIKIGDRNHRVWNAISEPIEKLFRNMDKRAGVQEALARLDGRLEALVHEYVKHASDIRARERQPWRLISATFEM